MTHISKAHWTAIDKRHRLIIFCLPFWQPANFFIYSPKKNIYDSNKQNKISHRDVDIIVGAISSSVKVNWMVGLVCARRNCKDQQEFACTTTRQKKTRNIFIYGSEWPAANYNCHTENVNFEIRKLCTRSPILSTFLRK